MCYNLDDFNPFEPLIILDDDDGEYIDSEPMSDYDWYEWLENEE